MDNTKVISGRPLQRISWTKKIANNGKWFEENADYLISQSTFSGTANASSLGDGKEDMRTMYNVYNNNIPLGWFRHVTDPLSAQDPRHKNFPAKVRPTNILRTTIDQLQAEWLHRPFPYRVENMGENGYNAFTEQLNKTINSNLNEMFVAMFQQEMIAQGMEEQLTQMTPDQIPMPTEIKKQFHASYKDKIAIKANKWMKRALTEYRITRTMHKGFKDYLISGNVLSYKDVVRGDLVYKRLSPLYADYEKSPDTDFVEDGDWATYMFLMTKSEVVDNFYDELKNKDHDMIENRAFTQTPTAFYDHLTGLSAEHNKDLIPVYLTTWKGRKMIKVVHFQDPETGEPQELKLDEIEKDSDILAEYGPTATIEKMWVNEVYETWRIQEDIYVRKRAVIAQRNALNNFSVTKLPINGRRYSDTHSPNISVLKIGIPYLIMHMIVNRTLELTIAKSKGKILLMDNNAIPRQKGWTEEKFFYYSEALGYGLIDRNQIGVDKSWNQYTVVDMSLFDQIQQLIELSNHYRQEWDNIIGFNNQRKGQTYASETNSANEFAKFQSTLITEMIFVGYDEYVEKELQGILDLSKFVNAEGLRKLFNGSVDMDALLEVTPEEYCNADLGILITDNPQDRQVLDMMKQMGTDFIQNGVKASTILSMFQAGNVSELKADLLLVEELQAQIEKNLADSEAAQQAAADQRAMEFMEAEKVLEEQLINVEWDRRDQNEGIKGSFNIASYGNPEDADMDGVPDAAEIMKRNTELAKIASNERLKNRDIASKERMNRFKEFVSLRKQETIERNKKEMNDKKVAADIQKAKISARAKPKKTS